MKLFVDLKNAPPVPFNATPPLGLSVGCSKMSLVLWHFFYSCIIPIEKNRMIFRLDALGYSA
ncbi:hypothetical protein BZL53_11520 [Flavobacterium columnare]|uniref:hypothetical protein n=1 Tax=Flavobacterium columnare TaxID=996 RepID=UPI0009809FDE|nr:hypothetical protein [Flavobacterium columnare]OOB82005.1 hypothetical protein BZL53_11520 [Flavobacterium columnare]